MKFVWLYLVILNIISFLFYGCDKIRAIVNKRRISERTLFFVSFIGGSLGAFFGMLYFHHKTRKIKFYVFNIFSFVIWLYLLSRMV